MKKLLGIVVLGLLWVNVCFAEKSETYVCTDVNSPSIPLELTVVYGEGDNFGVGYLGSIPLLLDVGKYMYDFSLNTKKDTEGLTGGNLFLNRNNGIFQAEFNMKSGKILKIEGSCQISFTSGGSDKSSEESTKVSGSSGTAFFINNRGHLLTNNHVVQDCSSLRISYKNKDYEVKLIATDKFLDLALLKAKINPNTFFNFSKDQAKKLNKIYVAGYPLGKGLSDDLKISSGIVSSIKGFQDNSNEIQIDAPINPGNSGGPIINEDGELVAIAVSGLAKDQTEGINFGIKASAAESFLRSNKIKPGKSIFSSSKLTTNY